MTQKEFLSKLLSDNPNATIIGSLGTISYDLSDMAHDKKILVRGAMGAVMGAGLGYALGKPEEQVIVCIGDGSFLMKMGSMSTIAKHKLPNLQIYVIDNGMHKSTGGQKTNIQYLGEESSLKVIKVDEILS